MANWILFDRGDSGEPIVSAMHGGTAEKTISGNSKANLIGFLKRFDQAGTFLIKKHGDDGVEAVELLGRNDPNPAHQTTPADATWFHFFRGSDGQPIVVAMKGATGVEFYQGNLRTALIEFLSQHRSANTFQVAPADAEPPSGLPEWKPGRVVRPAKGRVLLEIGHGPGSSFDPGAIAHDGRTTEHELNTIAANAAQKVLVAAGVSCDVTDVPDDGSLYDIGLKAAGFDVFCSVHHNALRSGQSVAQRAEAFTHAVKGGAADEALAALIAAEVAQELNISDQGAKQAKLGVLSGAEDTNVRASVLAEVYFIDFVGGTVGGRQYPKPNLKDYSTRGGEAIGRAILEWLNRN